MPALQKCIQDSGVEVEIKPTVTVFPQERFKLIEEVIDALAAMPDNSNTYRSAMLANASGRDAAVPLDRFPVLHPVARHDDDDQQ